MQTNGVATDLLAIFWNGPCFLVLLSVFMNDAPLRALSLPTCPRTR